MIIYLDSRVSNPQNNIKGLPSEEEFFVRALESRVGSPDLFHRAREHRDRLETKNVRKTDSIENLGGILDLLCSFFKKPEMELLQLMEAASIGLEEKAVLLRLIARAGAKPMLQRQIREAILWDQKVLDEKTTKRLIDILRSLGIELGEDGHTVNVYESGNLPVHRAGSSRGLTPQKPRLRITH